MRKVTGESSVCLKVLHIMAGVCLDSASSFVVSGEFRAMTRLGCSAPPAVDGTRVARLHHTHSVWGSLIYGQGLWDCHHWRRSVWAGSVCASARRRRRDACVRGADGVLGAPDAEGHAPALA